GGWCSVYRKLMGRMKANTIFGELKEIDLQGQILRVAWWEPINYDTLINTLPLDYFLRKIGKRETATVLKGIPLYVSLHVVKSRTDAVTLRILGRKKYNSVYTVILPGEIYGVGDVSMAYVVLPYERLMPQGSFIEKAYSDLSRMGFKKGNVTAVRGYFEKYGVLRSEKELANIELPNVVLAGRLGRWKEMGICELIEEYSA
ncbi:MAG: hypothetical protein J7L55_02155, partial [Desulfurococcales archaeon]|nr:hypothetical protein [Desulfurococcales archaeon]